MAEALARRVFVAAPRRRRGMGGLAPLPVPSETVHVDPATAAHGAVAANVAAIEAHKLTKWLLIGGAISFSIGASMLLSAESEGYQKAGGVLTGAGLASGGGALYNHLREQQVRSLRDRYIQILTASGHPVPAEAGATSYVAGDGV